jgi:hypothetical protein
MRQLGRTQTKWFTLILVSVAISSLMILNVHRLLQTNSIDYDIAVFSPPQQEVAVAAVNNTDDKLEDAQPILPTPTPAARKNWEPSNSAVMVS